MEHHKKDCKEKDNKKKKKCVDREALEISKNEKQRQLKTNEIVKK